MRVGLLGTTAVTGPSGVESRLTRPQPRVCLALLVLERHRPVPREELAHVLWGDELSPHWPGAARGIITRVRDAFDVVGLPRSALSTSGGLVHVDLPADAVVDVEDARRAVEEADAAMRAGRPGDAVARATPAVADLAAGFLPGIDLPWVDSRRRELEGLYRRAQRLRAEAHLAAGQGGLAVGPARSLLEVDPYDESVHLLLVAALAASGDRLGGLAALDACRDLFQRELGVGPSPEALALQASLAGTTSPGSRTAPVPTPVPVTPRRPATPAGDFVGRGAEQALLVDEVLRPPRSGLPAGLRVVVVDGEAGVGKTRLAHEVADVVEPAGVRVLWGRCGPDTGLPYEPVVEALTTIVGSEALGTIDLADLRGDLAALVPAARSHDHTGPVSPEHDRSRLFRAATLAFERFATGPVLWVVDDLQWASADTLALLGHLGTHLASAPLTIVTTARERPPAVAATLAHLARQVPLRGVGLEGLGVVEVDRWLTAAAIRPAEGLAEDVQLRTGGNPLYLGHLLRAAVDAGGELDPTVVPVELQAFLDQRIAAQPPDAALVLAVASAANGTVDLDALGSVTGLATRDLLAAIDALVATRLLQEDQGGGGVRFAHALLRDAVAAGVGPSRRAWYHQRLAEHLVAQPGRPGRAAEVAHHLAASGPVGAERARSWSLDAAEEALDQAAWEAAARHLAQARPGGGLDPDDRIRALVASGRLARARGDRAATFAALDEAIALARVHRSPRRLAEAVLALVGGGGRGVADHARHRWLDQIEEALAGLGPTDHDLRAPLLGSFALALLLTGRDDERRAAAEEALRLARADGDPFLVTQALLDHRQARIEPEHAAARLADLDEVLDLTRGTGRLGQAIAATMYQHEDRLLLGDRTGARASLVRAEALLAEHPDPYWAWSAASWRVLDHVLDGRLEEAEAAALDAVSVGSVDADREAGAEAVACFGVNLVLIRLHQGRAGEVVDLLAQAADENPGIPCYRAVLALCLVESGQADRARAELDRFAADGFAGIPHDTNRLLAFGVLAEVACQLGAAEAAPALLAELEPIGGCQVVLNCFGGGGAVWGPVSAQLAGLSRLVGDQSAAERWEAEAWASSSAMGSTFVVARSAARRAASSDGR